MLCFFPLFRHKSKVFFINFASVHYRIKTDIININVLVVEEVDLLSFHSSKHPLVKIRKRSGENPHVVW